MFQKSSTSPCGHCAGLAVIIERARLVYPRDELTGWQDSQSMKITRGEELYSSVVVVLAVIAVWGSLAVVLLMSLFR